MTVLLVLFFFATFLLIDHFHSRNKVFIKPYSAPALPLRPSLVNGFSLPENLLYHPGHTWAFSESPTMVRVGMDDFAAKMVGKVDSLSLSQRGMWVRQGQAFATVTRDGRSVSLVSPIEGTVVEINPNALLDPNTARKDSYGGGWLMTVNSPDKKTCFRNLLSGKLAKWWIEEATTRLHPAMAQDGGEACDDFLTEMGSRDWEATTKEFLLN